MPADAGGREVRRPRRPTPTQRSTLELLRDFSMMGPMLVQYALADTPDWTLWARGRNRPQTPATSMKPLPLWALGPTRTRRWFGNVPDARFRTEVEDSNV